MMTYSDEWEFNRTHLMKILCMGRDKFQRVMKELGEFGYVELDVSRFDAAPLIAFTAAKETGYGTETDG